MKKKLLTLFIICVLAFSFVSTAMAADGTYQANSLQTNIIEKNYCAQYDAQVNYYLKLYNQLGLASKIIYDALLENVAVLESGTTQIKVVFPPEIEKRDVAFIDYVNAVSAFTRDHSEIFWLDFNHVKIAISRDPESGLTTATIAPQMDSYYISPYKTVTKVQSDRQALANGISRAIDSVDKTAGVCDQLKQIHDWICGNAEYNKYVFLNDMRMFEAVSALDLDPNTKPVCEGYARAFKLLCDELSIPCILVGGDGIVRGESISHMWNQVYIDGAWYAVDVTWDDDYANAGSSKYDYFLVGSNDEINSVKFSDSHIASEMVNYGGDNFKIPDLSETGYIEPEDSTLSQTLLQGFYLKNEYSSSLFSDVKHGDWYENNVASAFELGLMVGNGDGTFNVNGGIRISETISIAARIHSTYYGMEIPQSGDVWYEGSVKYALDNGLIDHEYQDYGKPITRREFARILSHALPADKLGAINDISEGQIPDVKAEEEIYMLYNAGVLRGDEDGSFHPDAEIRRCEVAAIVTRMADTSLRVVFVL